MFKNTHTYFFLAITIFAFDRITKILALMYAQSKYIINQYLAFELTFNRGISWGIFHDTSSLFFIVLSLLIVCITGFLCCHAYYKYQQGDIIVGHVCIITGSVANLIDRALYGGVIDFILLSYNNYSWPVFNLADTAIVCGVGLLIFLDEQSIW